DRALDLLDVDAQGFDHMDRRLLLTMIDKFDGGPVGIDSLAAAISEERHTIEDVLEPYLIQQGFIMRTPRGRVVTRHAYLHSAMDLPASSGPPAGDLFAQSVMPRCRRAKKILSRLEVAPAMQEHNLALHDAGCNHRAAIRAQNTCLL